jgi:ComF family protein
VVYTSVFRKVVHRFKYRGQMRLAGPLGKILLATYLRFWNSGDIDLILPVPLHPKRFRQRGFNQAYRLVVNWKQFEKGLAATPGLLVKTRVTAPQSGLQKAQRRRNVRNAFRVQRPEAVRSRRVLLVDDVYTTGATADECARVLLRYGAARVEVLTLARVS